MQYIKEHLIPVLFGSLLGGIGTLLVSIYSDFLPALMPILQALPVQLYMKIILLLLSLILILSAFAFVLFTKTKSFKPRSLSGTDFGFKWTAELEYNKRGRLEIDTQIQWLCPKHKIFLHLKDALVPNCSYHKLFCIRCDRVYEIHSGGDSIYLEQARDIVEQKIFTKVRYP